MTISRRWRWRAAATGLTLAVAASLTAALVGLAARGSATGEAPGRPVPTTEQPVPTVATDPDPGGQVLLEAPLTSLDGSASGTVTLLDIGGALTVRLSAFDTHAGLGYVLYLVPLADARTPADGVSLGALKGASGDQNYPVPVGARVEGPLTLLIWSRGFKGPVGHATLRH